MTLIKSISGIRGTIGGQPGEGLSPVDVVKYTAAYAEWVKLQHPGQTITVVVGRDARISGPMVQSLVVATLSGMGCMVVDLGMATTPTTEIAVKEESAQGGIILTASHNPKQWNALKLLNQDGEFLSAADGALVLEIAEKELFNFAEVDDLGEVFEKDYTDIHIQQVLDLELVDVKAIREANFKVAIDAVNSVGGVVIPKLLKALGVKEVVEINCEATGHFAHTPEPLPENLVETAEIIREKSVDVGFVVDPDVDRLAIISEDGSMFNEEYSLVSIADYVLSQNSGKYGFKSFVVACLARYYRKPWRNLFGSGCWRGECGSQNESNQCRYWWRRQWRNYLSCIALRPRLAGWCGFISQFTGQVRPEMLRVAQNLPGLFYLKK